MSLKPSTGVPLPSVEGLRETVYEIVAQIPRGRVLTYGAIARLAGYPNHSRLVGRIMRGAPDGQRGLGLRPPGSTFPYSGLIARRRGNKVVPLRQSLLEDIPLDDWLKSLALF